MLGPNLIRNPDCIFADGEWGMGSLGPHDWISFSEKIAIASQQGVISEPGTYKLILTYESDAPFRAVVGNAPFQTVPASAGGVFVGDFVVTDYDSLAFQDRDEAATGRILRAELRKVT